MSPLQRLLQVWGCRNVWDFELGYKQQGWLPASSLEVEAGQSSRLSRLLHSRLLRCPPPRTWSVWERRKRKGFTLGGCGFEFQLLHVLALTFSPHLLKRGWRSSCHMSLWTRSWAECFTRVILWTPKNSPISYILLITLFHKEPGAQKDEKKWPKW